MRMYIYNTANGTGISNGDTVYSGINYEVVDAQSKCIGHFVKSTCKWQILNIIGIIWGLSASFGVSTCSCIWWVCMNFTVYPMIPRDIL